MKVAIVGGSVAGLAAARTLLKLGVDVCVFERSRGNLADRGAGISLDPAVVPLIGAVRGTQIRGRVVVGRSGRELWRHAAAKFVTSWSQIYRTLAAGVPERLIRRGEPVVRCATQEDFAELHLENGPPERFDLVIGADGVGSTVRLAVEPDFAPAYCGYVAIRGVTPEEALPAAGEPLARLADDPGLVNLYGSMTHAVAYWVPLRDGGRGLNWMWYRNVPADELDAFLSDDAGRVRRWSLPPGRMPPESRSKLLSEMREQLPESLFLVAKAAPELSQQAIYRGVPESVVSGRAILIGDAGHVAIPHIGAGVSLAMRDVAALAESWDPADLHASLATWGRRQREDADRNLQAAVKLGQSLQLEKHDWETWTPQRFDAWWSGITAGHGLYFEAENKGGLTTGETIG